jgi:Skp family chaperone for outer membrane proteins
MKRANLLPALALAALMLIVPQTARAQDRPIKVAVANVPRIFNDLQETKDLDARLQQERQKLAAEEKSMVDGINALKAEGGNFHPDAPQFDDWRERYINAQATYKTWLETNKAKVDWRRKRQTRQLYDKIYAAVTEYATRNAIDLVLADHQPTMSDKELEQVPGEQLGAILNQRRVIFASKAADISDPIIALLDGQYKAGGAGGTAGGNNAAPATAGSRTQGGPRQQQPTNR